MNVRQRTDRIAAGGYDVTARANGAYRSTPQSMNDALADDGLALVSSQPAGEVESRVAIGAVALSALLFVAAVPFAKLALAPVPAFIPAYESALVVCDLVTAVLLFGQHNALRARAILVLACGYLYSAIVSGAHLLTFPGAFSPGGLLGAGSQSTVWLYIAWHSGFPILIVAYALLKNARVLPDPPTGSAPVPRHRGNAVLAGVFGTIVVACALIVAATSNIASLPALIVGGRFTSLLSAMLAAVWALSVAALAILWRGRPRTALDVWLLVVMGAWIFEIGLSAVFNAARYDLGWYAGRIYGLVSASALLVALLVENARRYSWLRQLSTRLKFANDALERLSMEDALTGLANRRLFDATLATQVAVSRRHDRVLALVLCDVDSFKAYNDFYGHPAGDESLRRVAAALESCCRRPADLAARYGGEEFALILPDTDLAGAERIAEAARSAVEGLRIPHKKSAAGRHVSISGGVSVLIQGTAGSAQQLIVAADRALYQAKQSGRNRVRCAQPEATARAPA